MNNADYWKVEVPEEILSLRIQFRDPNGFE